MTKTKQIRPVFSSIRHIELNTFRRIVHDLAKTTNLAVIIGATLFVITSMLLILFVSHENETKKVVNVLLDNHLSTKKMRYLSELTEFARTRTRLTSQILDSDDLFEKDEINQRLEHFAGRYAETYKQLKALPLSDAEKEKLFSQDEIVSVILPAQRKSVELAMHDDNKTRIQAKKIYYETVLPGQNKLILSFQNMIKNQQQYIEKNTLQTIKSLHKTKQSLMLLATIIIFLIAVIVVLAIRKVNVIQSELERSRDELEQKVRERTNELMLSRDEAESANRAKSEFLSCMSHELRTPMTAILGFAQILEYDNNLDTDQQDSIQEVIKAGHHLLELINEILDLAKIESGNIDISLEAVQLDKVVSECLSLTTSMAEDNGITITAAQMDGCIVHADRTKLKQILLNLLTNSIKYNREQGKVKIHMDTAGDNTLRLTVSDTGYGIADEKIEELFQPFNRLNAVNSKIEGTGIGLAITRHLVEIMGGRIGVDSEPGTGSNFWVEFSVDGLQLDVQDNKNISDVLVSSTENSKQTFTVLYIEDNQANLRLVSQILNNHEKIKLITAHDAELGLELAYSHRPELILLDINMPGMNGYQVLDILQMENKLMDIPVLAVTANAMPRDIERGKNAGFSDYLTKPFNIPLFLTTIDKYLK